MEARDELSFQLWLGRIQRDMTPEERELWGITLSEVGLALQTTGKVSGAEAVRAAVRERIDGQRVREVLVAGGTLRWARLERERQRLVEIVRFNEDEVLSSELDEAGRQLRYRFNDILVQLERVLRDQSDIERRLRPYLPPGTQFADTDRLPTPAGLPVEF